MGAANLIRRALIAALFLVHATHAWAADAWVEVKSENFTVMSNDGERKARDMAWQFEQIRTAIDKGWPWARVKLARPLLVIDAKDENTMKSLLPGFWEKRDQIRPSSFFMTGPDRYYIALRGDLRADDKEGINPYSSAYWSYSTLALEANFSRVLPLWLVRGMSAVLSNSIVRQSEIQFGRPTPSLVRIIQNQPRLNLPDLLAVNGQSASFLAGGEIPIPVSTSNTIDITLACGPIGPIEPISARYESVCWIFMLSSWPASCIASTVRSTSAAGVTIGFAPERRCRPQSKVRRYLFTATVIAIRAKSAASTRAAGMRYRGSLVALKKR